MGPLVQLSLLAELSLHMLPGGEVGNQSTAGLQGSAVRASPTAALGTGTAHHDSSHTGVLDCIASIFTAIFCT